MVVDAGLRPVAGGLAFVRAHPEMFRGLVHDGPAAAALLAEAALRGSSTSVTVSRSGEWYVVRAEHDWLTGDRDPFTEVIPFPALGANAIRPEVIVAAFATAMATVTNDGVRVIAGEAGPIEGLVPDLERGGRAIVFAMNPPEVSDRTLAGRLQPPSGSSMGLPDAHAQSSAGTPIGW
jgi:hypothetical protein